jgi:hypothetical protein
MQVLCCCGDYLPQRRALNSTNRRVRHWVKGSLTHPSTHIHRQTGAPAAVGSSAQSSPGRKMLAAASQLARRCARVSDHCIDDSPLEVNEVVECHTVCGDWIDEIDGGLICPTPPHPHLQIQQQAPAAYRLTALSTQSRLLATTRYATSHEWVKVRPIVCSTRPSSSC